MTFVSNIHITRWKEEETPRGEKWKYLDLSGEKLGVRVEELSPGGTSSFHHFHTAEEEHVLVLDGAATLMLGDDRKISLATGDHVWFAAGKEQADHIENTSNEPFRFLVFGERNSQDVVVYPEQGVMLIKGLGSRQFTYRPIEGKERTDS